MNPWSVLYFTSFIFYMFSGIYVWNLSKKSIINITFFLMCLTLSLWSIGYAFTTGADNVEQAERWRAVSTIGWSYFYSTMLIFFASITATKWVSKNIRYSFLLYIPATIFCIRFIFFDEGTIVKKSYGWVHVILYRSIWSNIFDFYYLFCVLAGFVLLFMWRKNTQSLRERKQIKIIVSTMVLALIGGGMTDTLLPILGIKILPLGILFCTIVVSGIWIAITKYKMMNLTQEIAAEHVLVTMMDPVIIMNNDYVIGRVNEAATDLTGFSSSELIGEEAKLILNNFNEGSKLLKELTENGFVNGYEVELISKNMNMTPCLCSGVGVKTDYGERIGVVLVLHDITRRRINEELINEANKKLKLKVSKLNNVFDNVGQGILTFKKDLKIQDEYSHECEKIFNRKIENEKLSHLLFPDDDHTRSFVDELLTNVFECEEDQRELYLPLLPDEVVTNYKVLSINYKFTEDQSTEPIIMSLITDVTAKKQLESKMEQERKTLKMVIKVLLNREDFIDLIKEYKSFAESDFVNSSIDNDVLLRTIHTFKGSFSQYYMLNLIDQLDKLEDHLYNYDQNSNNQINGEELIIWLMKDMEIIDNYIGKGFFKEGERFTISDEQLNKVEEKIQMILSAEEIRKVLPLIKNLRKRSFHELLSNYPDYTMQLSTRMGKKIKPFSITGDVVFVDGKHYQEIIKTLVHIFRDCVDHGIESEDERLENGKDLHGEISCEIKELSNGIQISIGDDGRGINILELENKVLEEGLMSRENFRALNDENKFGLIFKHRITTKLRATSLSGRGVGLSAVETAVIQCGGSIKVLSEINKGTQFIILLPKKHNYESVAFSSKNFMHAVVGTTQEIVYNKTGYLLTEELMTCSNKIELSEITVLIGIKGSINCLVIFSLDEYKARILLGNMVLGSISDENLSEFIDDVCGEIVNTILGNTLAKYQETKGIFNIGVPVIIRNSEGYIKYSQSENILYRLSHGDNYFNILMLLENGEDDSIDEYLAKGV